jgi:hypothetical protein
MLLYLSLPADLFCLELYKYLDLDSLTMLAAPVQSVWPKATLTPLSKG